MILDKFFLLFCISILFTTSCMKNKVEEYNGAICNSKFKVEAYNKNMLGVYELYIVDSLGKSKFILEYDTEQDYISDTCVGENIIFTKYKENQREYPKMYYEIVAKISYNTKLNTMTKLK